MKDWSKYLEDDGEETRLNDRKEKKKAKKPKKMKKPKDNDWS